jgi:hypothetical protein
MKQGLHYHEDLWGKKAVAPGHYIEADAAVSSQMSEDCRAGNLCR